jgi:hypothetical protein
MPIRRLDLNEVAVTATIFSIYATARGTARVLGILQLLMR